MGLKHPRLPCPPREAKAPWKAVTKGLTMLDLWRDTSRQQTDKFCCSMTIYYLD